MLLLLTACVKNPPPYEPPLGVLVPADAVGVDVRDDETGWPGLAVGAARLGAVTLADLPGAAEGDPDPAGLDAVLDGVPDVPTLGVLGPMPEGWDETRDTFVAAAGALIAAEAGRVDAWEVWEGPNDDGRDPAELADWTCALAGEIGGAASLASPGPTWAGGDDPVAWLEGFLDAGGGRCVDAFVVHSAADGAPEDVAAGIDAAWQAQKAAGYAKVPTWDAPERWGGGDPGGIAAAGIVAREILVRWPHGVDRTFLPTDGVALVDGSGQPTAAGTGLEVVADWIVGRDLTGCDTEGTRTTCTLRTETTHSLVVWDDAGPVDVAVPDDVTAIRTLDGGSTAPGETVSVDAVPVLLDAGS